MFVNIPAAGVVVEVGAAVEHSTAGAPPPFPIENSSPGGLLDEVAFEGEDGAYNPSCFSHSYKLSSVLNSGKGNQWYGYNVVKIGPVKDAALYERAKKFYTSLASK